MAAEVGIPGLQPVELFVKENVASSASSFLSYGVLSVRTGWLWGIAFSSTTTSRVRIPALHIGSFTIKRVGRRLFRLARFESSAPFAAPRMAIGEE